MRDATWQPGGGDINATKSLVREAFVFHHASETTGEMEVGEITHIPGTDLFYAKATGGVFVIGDAADIAAVQAQVNVETNSAGKGTVRYLVNQSSAPTTGASEGAFYTKQVLGSSELFYRYNSSGVEVQLTSGGAINAATNAQIIPLLDIYPDPTYPASNVLLGNAPYQCWAVSMADGSDSGFIGQATLPDSTKTYQLVLEMKQSSALSGRTVAISVQMKATQAGEDPAAESWDVAAVQAVSCRADTGLLVVESSAFRFPAASMHTDNQLVRVRVLRDGDGTGAADDHTGATYLVNAFFKAVP